MHRHGNRAAILLFALAMLLGSAASSAPSTAAQAATPTVDCPAPTPAQNLEVVRSFYDEGVNRADLSVFDRVAAPDIVYHGATVGDESGLEALRRIYGEALTGLPGLKYTLLTSVADGDAVALRYAVEGVHTGDFRGLAPTGKTITWNHSAFAHVQCGRISEMWAEIDQLDRLRGFGILAAEGPAARMAGAAAGSPATPAVPVDSASCAPLSQQEMIAVVDRVRSEVYNTMTAICSALRRRGSRLNSLASRSSPSVAARSSSSRPRWTPPACWSRSGRQYETRVGESESR
jgi:predicted ester cyclase